jgi:uncharacterized membrane protein (UPF0127 family)
MRSRNTLAFVLALPVLLDCSATSGGEAQAAPSSAPSKAVVAKHEVARSGPRVVLAPTGQDPVAVRVEVVQKTEDRQRGLMYRKHLDADAGMLFLFERPQPLTFWMHDTLLPLDMIFIAADKTVLGVVENATPLTDDARSVPGLSQYVLEVNAGFARRHSLSAGTVVRFVDVAQDSVR